MSKLSQVLQIYSGDADDNVRENLGCAASDESKLAEAVEQLAARDQDINLRQFSGGDAVAEFEQFVAERVESDEKLSESRGDLLAQLGRPIGQRSRRWALIAAGIVGSIVMGFGATWALHYDTPLLEDNFNDNWYNSRIWNETPEVTKNSGIGEENGVLRLVNRGYLVTRKEFPAPISVSFDWRWLTLKQLDPHYSDHLTVALRTSGRPRPVWQHEVTDGIIVKIDAYRGHVSIWSVADPEGVTTTLEDFVLPMPAEQWMNIRITDDGKTICVYMAGKHIAPQYRETPILSFQCEEEFPEHHIAFYNRELVKFTHESHIDNVVIRKLPSVGGD